MGNWGKWAAGASRVGLAMTMLGALAGCSTSTPVTPVTPVAAPVSVAEVCGRKPANLSGSLSSATADDIKLFVDNDGSDATARHVRESLSKERLACDVLSYRACEAAVKDGASQGLALETHRMAMAASACQKSAPQPVAVAPKPKPTPRPPVIRPTPKPTPKPTAKLPQWRPGTFMVQAFSRVTSSAQKVQKRTDYRFESTGAAVLGAFLMRGQTITMKRPLKRGVKYVIIGGGSDSVQDLDIEVLDSKGRRVGHDTGPESIPVAEFKAPTDGSYTVKLRLSATKSSGSFTAIAIMRSTGGYNVPVKRLAKSFGTSLAMAASANDTVKKRQGRSLVYHADADWCFYGIVLKQNQSITFRGIQSKKERTVVLGATDGTATDFDLRVLDKSNKVVTSDTGSGNRPVVGFNPIPTKYYGIEASVNRASGPSLVTVMVLDVVK